MVNNLNGIGIPSSKLVPVTTTLPNSIDKTMQLANAYLDTVAHTIPNELHPDDVICKLGNQQIPLDIHRVSLLEDHYIASPRWASYDATLFWSMIFQQQPALIVKLSQSQPTAQDSLYWPNKIGLEWKSMNPLNPTIKCLNIEKVSEDIIKRTFRVTLADKSIEISQLDFCSWEDMTVPTCNAFESFLKEVIKLCPETSPSKRILVHCREGVGRTGTFMALHSTCALPVEAKAEENFFPKLIMDMRRQRPKPMVETPEQFVFLHEMALRPPLSKVPELKPPSLSDLSGLSLNQKADIEKELKKKEREQLRVNLKQNIEALFIKLDNFEVNALEIVQFCEKALIGLAQVKNPNEFNCPQAFDIPLKGLLGNSNYNYVFDNHYPDSKKLRKGAPLCLIKALAMKGTDAQARANLAVFNLVRDYLANCQGGSQDLEIKLIVYALSKAYYDSMVDKLMAAASLKDWWGQSPEHIATLRGKFVAGSNFTMNYNIPL